MKREKIKKILIDLGMPEGTKGLDHIADAVILMSEGWEELPMQRIYWKIAKDNEVDYRCIERRIRIALNNARKNGVYIATVHPQNKEFLIWTYKFIKEHEEARVI